MAASCQGVLAETRRGRPAGADRYILFTGAGIDVAYSTLVRCLLDWSANDLFHNEEHLMHRPGTQTNPENLTGIGPNPNAILLVNPGAGRRKRLRPRQIREAKQELESAGIAVAVEEIGEGRDGSERARTAVEQGADLIIVCGGDGTINHVIRGMVPSRVPLAVLPGGTANMLARELGIPLRIVDAARGILTSVPRRISLGSAGGRLFISLAGIGFDARVIQALNANWKAAFGIGSYVMETLRQLCLISPNPLFTIFADGLRQQASFVCVSKSQHYGPIRAIPQANLFSDQFYVYSFQSQSRWRYLHYAAAILANRKFSLPAFSEFPARRIDCELIRPEEGDVFFQVDGELAGSLPCRIEIVPDALTVLTPGG